MLRIANYNKDWLNKETILQALRTSDIFQGLNKEALSRIATFCHKEIYQPGEIIFVEGDIAKKLYIVTEGKVALEAKLSTRSGSTRQATIETIPPGEAFGWSAAIRASLTMSARAVTVAKALAIDGEALQSLVAEDPETGLLVMRNVIGIVYSRLSSTRNTLAHILSVASHDLKAPLAAVQSYLQVILGGFAGELNDKQRKMLSRSCIRIAEFIEMIDNVLDISRFEAGQIKMAELSLSEVVRDAIEALRPLAEEKGLNLTLDLPQEMIKIKGSTTHLKRVITNLVGNAIKFTPPGGEILVKLKEDDGHARVEVADTGMGISGEDLPKLFTDFYRGLAGDTAAKGAGLGLSISKRIIEAHGGRIWAESPCPETRRGSKFNFTLPKDKGQG